MVDTDATLPDGRTVATAQLAALDAALANVDLARALAALRDELDTIPLTICETRLDGLHDLFNREQLIGELRGTRKFLVDIQTRREELIAEIEEQDKPHGPNNDTGNDGDSR